MKRITKELRAEVALVAAYLRENEVSISRDRHTYIIEKIELQPGALIMLILRGWAGGPRKTMIVTPEMEVWQNILTPAQAELTEAVA